MSLTKPATAAKDVQGPGGEVLDPGRVTEAVEFEQRLQQDGLEAPGHGRGLDLPQELRVALQAIGLGRVQVALVAHQGPPVRCRRRRSGRLDPLR